MDRDRQPPDSNHAFDTANLAWGHVIGFLDVQDVFALAAGW